MNPSSPLGLWYPRADRRSARLRLCAHVVYCTLRLACDHVCVNDVILLHAKRLVERQLFDLE
jgi:hypothetical protein